MSVLLTMDMIHLHTPEEIPNSISFEFRREYRLTNIRWILLLSKPAFRDISSIKELVHSI